MNKIEEVYVFCNRVRWHTAYIPQPEHQVTLALLLHFLLLVHLISSTADAAPYDAAPYAAAAATWARACLNALPSRTPSTFPDKDHTTDAPCLAMRMHCISQMSRSRPVT